MKRQLTFLFIFALVGISACKQGSFKYLSESDSQVTSNPIPVRFSLSPNGLEGLYNASFSDTIPLENDLTEYNLPQEVVRETRARRLRLGPLSTQLMEPDWRIAGDGPELSAELDVARSQVTVPVQITYEASSDICRFRATINEATASVRELSVIATQSGIRLGTIREPSISVDIGSMEPVGSCAYLKEGLETVIREQISRYVKDGWIFSVQRALRLEPLRQLGLFFRPLEWVNPTQFQNRDGSSTLFSVPYTQSSDVNTFRDGLLQFGTQLSFKTSRAECAPNIPIGDAVDITSVVPSNPDSIDIGMAVDRSLIYRSINHLISSGLGCSGYPASPLELDPQDIQWRRLQFREQINQAAGIKTNLRLENPIEWNDNAKRFGSGQIKGVTMEFFAEKNLGIPRKYLTATFDISFELASTGVSGDRIEFIFKQLEPENVQFRSKWSRSSKMNSKKRSKWLQRVLFILSDEGFSLPMPFGSTSKVDISGLTRDENTLIFSMNLRAK